MSGKWFANRAQIAQVVCAVLAVGIAVFVAWPQITTRLDFQLVLEILMYPAAVFIVFQIGKSFGTKSEKDDFHTEVNFFNPVIKIGAYWETGDSLNRLRVAVISTQNYKARTFDLLGAELALTGLASQFSGGEKTQENRYNVFLVPASSSGYALDSSIFTFSTAKEYIDFVSIRVDHINVPAQEVLLEICKFSFRKRRIPPS